MYIKVEYASWLNATYGLSESIRELVPSRKVPPLYARDPPAPAASAITAASASTPNIVPTSSRFRIELLLLRPGTKLRPR
jgi:hypothetical protein